MEYTPLIDENDTDVDMTPRNWLKLPEEFRALVLDNLRAATKAGFGTRAQLLRLRPHAWTLWMWEQSREAKAHPDRLHSVWLHTLRCAWCWDEGESVVVLNDDVGRSCPVCHMHECPECGEDVWDHDWDEFEDMCEPCCNRKEEEEEEEEDDEA